MPSWKIHSKIANDLAKKIKINRKYFMIGNLLPDQDKYNIPGLHLSIKRSVTHFIDDEDMRKGINLPDYNRFYEKYEGYFDNPVLLGYLVHLMSDYFWNKYIYDKYFIFLDGDYVAVKLNSGEIYNCSFREMNSIKQKDLEIFNNSLCVRKNNFRFCLNSNYFERIDELKISKSNVYLVGKYLNLSHKKANFPSDYKMLNQAECYSLIEASEKFILNFFDEKGFLLNN